METGGSTGVKEYTDVFSLAPAVSAEQIGEQIVESCKLWELEDLL